MSTSATKPKVFKSYSDAGHGWIAVKRKYLIELGIADKITHYSYQRGATVYVEEDCDASLLINTLEAKQVEFEIAKSKYTPTSPIRSYQSYSV